MNRCSGCFTARQTLMLCAFLSAHHLQWCVSMTQALSAGAGEESLAGHLAGGGGVHSQFIKEFFNEPASVSPSASNVIHPSFTVSLFSIHPNLPHSFSPLCLCKYPSVSLPLSMEHCYSCVFIFINRVKVLIDSGATHEGCCSYCTYWREEGWWGFTEKINVIIER